ncbi:hypothetical protein GA0070606_3669 [Micromonospora citrea]|uniref:Uncharacterized protein n=1 Tax=Micromonospora citrea TaxID=47855 RepID=A0A1C6V8Y2_9ACTN|nr:hypothetical protein GA0070606_3669 [Micromonospora citrea]
MSRAITTASGGIVEESDATPVDVVPDRPGRERVVWLCTLRPDVSPHAVNRARRTCGRGRR